MDKPFMPTLPLLFPQNQGAFRHVRAEGAEAVSILMRTKDRPIMLPRAIRSVVSQHFADWRLYLVNDGGDPATLERVVAEHAEALAGRLTLIHHAESQGMEAASNRALRDAQGEFVAVHDDDDTWHPDFLQRTVDFLSAPANAACVGVVTNCRIVWERIIDGRVVEESHEPFPAFTRNIELRRMLAGNRFPPISLLLRRAVVLLMGPFNAELPVLGDWEFNMRMLALGDLGVIEEPLAYYHHRREVPDAIYGNSVVADTLRHQRYDTLLRNSIIRIALRDNPATIGVLQPILHALRDQSETDDDHYRSLDERTNELLALGRTLENRVRDLHVLSQHLDRRLDGLHDLSQHLDRRLEGVDRRLDGLDQVRTLAAWIFVALRPVRWLWRCRLPVQRGIARLRRRG